MILVTGGTGFLGSAVVDVLLARGDAVRVLARHPHEPLADRGVEVVVGDVLDPPSLGRAFAGATRVLHLAGRVDRSPGASSDLFRLHVDGTRNVVRAAAEARTEKVVHVSTSGTTAVSDAADPIKDERADWAISVVRRWPYYLSKVFAEKVALEAFSPGVRLDGADARVRVPVTIVSPSLILGPGDTGLSSSREVVRFLRREVPAIPRGGVNFVDVRDAAQAVVAALDKGRPGERYLVGGSNVSLEAFFVLLEKVSGVAAPTLTLSTRTQNLASRALGEIDRLLDLDGDEAAALDMGSKFWYLDASKARAELGFAPRPPEVTLRDTVEWIRAQGPLPRLDGLLGQATRTLQTLFGGR